MEEALGDWLSGVGCPPRLTCRQPAGWRQSVLPCAMSATHNVRDLLDGHVGLQLESIDRLYLNGYVPKLQ
jgi:hypothetical protein